VAEMAGTIENGYDLQISNLYYQNKAANTNAESGNVAADNSELIGTLSEQQTAQKSDSITIGGTEYDDLDSGIYSKERIDALQQVQTMESQRVEKFNQFVESILQNQNTSKSIANAENSVSIYMPDSNGDVSLISLNPSIEDIQKAKEAVSDGGEYSVDKVATRIMDMASALSGFLTGKSDEDKISILRDSVEKGFKSVTDLYGDKTPQITKDTYNEVMSRFDTWQKDIETNKQIANAAASVTAGNINAQAAYQDTANAPTGQSQVDKQVAQGNVGIGVAAI
jgi:hypothetical protein